ncbi:hybrid sensor histidine kinase/response regulator [Dyella caseinilytica]|uniref:histidine kinase n=1 Tax=Dyella caseinilytica TaxID=1849581 RepID=A0ABX7GRK2_9GAMM|nr:hybrid sensor histidine kinase/response regulator [Dyella caseinilytica]QRN52708.1 response regulator [Dyella caseinilytica]
MRTEVSPEGRELSALRRHQRHLLYGGGCLLTLLILLAAVSSVLSGINHYHAQQRGVFQDGQEAIDYFLTQRDRANANGINVSDTVWGTQRDLLLKLGTPIARDFLAQGQQALITAPNKVAVPWLTLGLGADAMQPDQLAAYLGLIHEYSAYSAATVAFVQSTGKLSAYVYNPSGSLLAVAGFRDEAQLLSALKVSSREKAFAALMRGESRIRKTASPQKGAIGSGDGRVVSYYGLNPFNGEPSLIGVITFMDEGNVYIRRVILEPIAILKQRLIAETPGAFAIFTHDGDVVLEADMSPLLHQAELFPLLQSRSLWKDTLLAPVLMREHGIYMIAGPLRGVDWTMVHMYSWRDVVAAESSHATKVAAMTLLILAVLWALLWRIDRRVFVPALEGASRVYESEALNRTIIETSPVGLCLLDPESGKSILQNDVVRHVLGTDDVAETEALFRQLIARVKTLGDAESHEFPWVLELPEGRARHLQVAISAAHYRNRAVQVCALRDITAQTELEDNLRRARRDSEQARAAAESASRAKSNFVATMSHEIRTPLNGVLGHLELLGRTPLEPSQRERLGRIRLSADALLAIISDVLDFSRIEAGQLDIDPVTFQLRPLIEQAALLYAPAAQRKGVKLYFAVEAGLAASYVADVHRIRQMLNNLLSNAVKFTESGRIILRVTKGNAVSQAQLWLRFQVIDSGIGMTAQQLSQLFEAFSQADASIARRYGGSGLGLALCRQLSQLLGGDIYAESTESVGSVFTLDLPVDPVDVPAEKLEPLRGRRLALLSAAPEWRTEIGSLLSAWGATVTVAAQPGDLLTEATHVDEVLVTFGASGTWDEDDERALIARYQHVVRAYADGPLVPELRDNITFVSCYDTQALLSALQAKARATITHPMHAEPQRPSARGSRGRILLVEDNPVNRELIQQQLQELGFEVDAAENGEAALVKWIPGKYLAVLTDINMPQMNGYDLAHQLRARDKHLSILAITATALASEIARCREVGISDVLLKPLTLDSLDDALSRYAPNGIEITPHATPSPTAGKVFPAHVRRVFVDKGISDLIALRDAMAKHDTQALIDIIHGFKGALLMLGESDAANACSVLESRLREEDAYAVEGDLPRLLETLDHVVHRFEADLSES